MLRQKHSQDKQCFMIYHYDRQDTKSQAINGRAARIFKELGYDCIRPNIEHKEGNIIENITNYILESDIIYVNISANPPNPNVYYELGIAHAMAKHTIIVGDQKSLNSLPFDISGFSALECDIDNPDEFDLNLKRILEHVNNHCEHEYNPLSSILGQRAK